MLPRGRLKLADVLRLTGRCSNAAQNFMTISETIAFSGFSSLSDLTPIDFSLDLSGYISAAGQATWSRVPSTLVADSAKEAPPSHAVRPRHRAGP